jgi:hypothetical protein
MVAGGGDEEETGQLNSREEGKVGEKLGVGR